MKIVHPGMSVTVVIVNWCSGELLERCLGHLSCQVLLPTRILVIDNGSEDGSEVCGEQFAGVEVCRLGANLGFAAANNRALAMLGDSEWVALLNPDAFPEPDWLQRLIEAAKKHPGYAMFASRQLMAADLNRLDGEGDAYHVSGLVWRQGYGRSLAQSINVPQEVFSPCAGAALYRKDALMAVGGFDEDFFCYVEDVDLGFRLRLAGHKTMYVPDAVVHHVGSATTGGQHSNFAVYHGHRNLVWTYVKNMPGWLFWAFLPGHLVMNLLTVCLFACRGQGRVLLKAKRDALLGLPKMWRKRQVIQRRRVASVGDILQVLNKSLIPGRKGREGR